MVAAKNRYVPQRGDIVFLQFDPQAGHEQKGNRPALVLSPKQYNGKVGLALVCPITSNKKGYPFEVELPTNLSIGGVVLSDQVKSLDWAERRAIFKCKAPAGVVEEAVAKIEALLVGV